MSDIIISGARQHNLKNVDVRIPRDSLTVVTGLSGSGKSSLAFDTLYAEGQRRYVESLSAYARQFLDQMQKPEVDHIEGLSPAISIEQRTSGGNPRSIVATVTEIHDYLRLLYGSVGRAHCPSCGKPVQRQSAEQIVDHLLAQPAGTRLVVLAPLVRGRKGRHEEVFESVRRQGFVRVRVDGEMLALEDVPRLDKNKAHTLEAVVDRLVVGEGVRRRLTDSVELALKQGEGLVRVQSMPGEGDAREELFSEKNACPDCALSFEELKPRAFSFNSPFGACPTCAGLGAQLVFDEDLVVPDKSLSLAEGAIHAWRHGGFRMVVYYKHLLKAVAAAYGIDMDTPYSELPEAFRQVLLHGSGDEPVTLRFWMRGAWRKTEKPYEGVLPSLTRRYSESEFDEVREKLRQYMSRQLCPDCRGARLRPEARACTVAGRSIVAVMAMTVKQGVAFFDALALPPADAAAVAEVLKEIRRRLKFLHDVGLDYLSLDRESSTLSGGEMQRIRLATQIGSGLVGVLYVLDEPTIGLHPRDNERLIDMLHQLQRRGNTVVIVEHDEEMIRSADYIVDMGPGAGRQGGEVVYQGALAGLLACGRSQTAAYLSGRTRIEVPAARVKPGKARLKITGASENNLKNIDVQIPLGCLVCVTGVSGSGKSTLVSDILKNHLFRHFYGSKERPGAFKKITGIELLDKVIEIDQSPIGRTPRSNPVTYTGAFTPIRELFAATPAAKVRGYGPGRFSFNVKGGRCEVCKGDGMRCLEMHFLPDIYVPCEQCGGLRYNKETLEIRYGGKTIAEVLDLTVEDALEFFAPVPQIANKLRTLSEVGLGYVHLGQSSTTLSGGEAQRIKLSAELSKRATGKTLYLLDEPTTGLHFADVHKLLDLLLRLRESGNTVVVIEHNLDIIKCADVVIDLGPGGGDEGGRLVVTGTPEAVAACPDSHTGRFLRAVLGT
ncbi:MAG: excinuclease ABC subunit UvrA [Kiritimatiellia bacterium]|jgi:excinuclease ABC subunit A|nr:excinuclease ABC subunit UvrA [Kiritimatiellia bacterium]MDD4440564.1 excinuclease ABC subunit UvrA [Kiritimatiellia bacterium]